MHLILCHQTADFDALGAAVGLSKLHPNAKIVLTGGAHRGVQDFLALFRNEFALVERRTVHLDQIKQLSVVDTQQRDRLGLAADWLDLPQIEQIALYDHHCQSQTDIPATEQQIEAVGATTTLIVEKLQAAHHTLTIAEATAMALGIHVDTGSLTYDQTTPRDGLALAWLLTQGADPATIRTYLEPGLTPELQTLLAQALDTFETHNQQGYQIAAVFLVTDAFVPGLSSLAERLIDLLDYDALLLGHQYQRRSPTDQRLTVIGRSRIPQTDLHELLAEWGGGHAQAAAATIKTTDGAAQFQAILQDWLTQIPPPLTARDLMSAPVRTIRPQTTITEAQRVLLRYGHSGLSVVNEQDELVGVISRQDLDIALHHGFGHAPAKAYMSRDPHTIAPTLGLPDIEALMVTYDVGRLPVVAAGNLIGIVTRTDVLRQRQTVQSARRQRQPKPWARCPIPHPQTLIEPRTWQLLERLAQAAQTRGWHLYLVGGVVRDLLLTGETSQPSQLQDIDLVVDGFHQAAQAEAGVELAKAVQQWYPEARLEVHGAFQTAALIWHKHPEFGSLALDIATARTEFYPYPAANPEVEASSIRQDLYRRDFTINAMALRLTTPREGEVLDFFGGMGDVRSRQIRVLHTNSFIEDPTRIYRAVRFAVRLGFELEPQTEELVRYAIASGVYGRSLTNYPKAPALTTRLKAELKSVLTAAYWQPAVELLSHLGAWQCLHPELHISPQVYPQLRLLDRSLRRFDPDYTLNHWQLRLELILLQLPPDQAVQVGRNLQLSEGAIARLQRFQPLFEDLAVQLTEDSQPSAIAAQLKPYNTALLTLLLVQLPRPQRQQIWQYLTRWSQLKAPLNGNDLQQLGYPRGPQYRVILNDLLNATLDGNIQTRDDALSYLQAVHPLTQS